MSVTATLNRETVRLAGKYLTFQLADEEYGLEILKVREIIGLMDITKVPRTPEFIRGVINLRGKIIPVLDLRLKFGLPTVQDTELSCIIVVDVSRGDTPIQMGVLVDTVSEVLDITTAEVEQAPSFGEGINPDFIQGIAKCKGGVKILLNVEVILSPQEIAQVAGTHEAAPADENSRKD